jgi:hypothetical protein
MMETERPKHPTTRMGRENTQRTRQAQQSVLTIIHRFHIGSNYSTSHVYITFTYKHYY